MARLSDNGERAGKQGFKPARRLRHRAAFNRVFRRNTRSSDSLFTVLARTSAEDGPRLGMAISIKATGGAVARNRVKRLVRESFRQNQGWLPRVDLVVIGRPGVGSQSNARILASLSDHWKRIEQRCKR